MQEYAKVSWTAGDVMSCREEMTREQAETFLAKYEGNLQDLLVERGWEAIETFLTMEGK